MATDVIIADDLWDGDQQAVITTWFVGDGAEVTKGMLVAEVMVEKIQHELRAPTDGVITILHEADSVVSKGDVLAKIE